MRKIVTQQMEDGMAYSVIQLPPGTSQYRWAVIDTFFDEEFARFLTKEEADAAAAEAEEADAERAAEAYYAGDRDFTPPYEP